MRILVPFISMCVLLGTAAIFLLFDDTPVPDEFASSEQYEITDLAKITAGMRDGQLTCRNVTQSYGETVVFAREGDLRLRTQADDGVVHALWQDSDVRVWQTELREGVKIDEVDAQGVVARVPTPAAVNKPRDLTREDLHALVTRGSFRCFETSVRAEVMRAPAPIEFVELER